MARRLILHTGLMKSGTSYLQQRLLAGKDELAAHGVLFPGRLWGDQVQGVSELLERRRVAGPDNTGAWQRLVDEIDAWDGVALISMEFLAAARRPKIEKLATFFPDTEISVVKTVRDLGRTVPAMWQETIKNAGTTSFEDYLAIVRERTPGPGMSFWGAHAAAAIVNRWTDVLGVDPVAVVTLPPPGAPPGLLWERFCEAAGLEQDVAPEVPTANESLGATSASVLRLVNQVLDAEEMDWRDYSPVVKFGLGKKILAPHRRAEPSIGFTVPDWLREHSERMIGLIAERGVRVVGTLDDLVPLDVPGTDPDAVPAEDQLEAAAHAIAGLVRHRIEARHRNGIGHSDAAVRAREQMEAEGRTPPVDPDDPRTASSSLTAGAAE